MSYESEMLIQFAMPNREQVASALLRVLFKHEGVIKEFAAGEGIVNEIADEFALNSGQRTASLETIYRKENRLKRSNLWHRLLFRAADSLAAKHLVSRPSETAHLTGEKEWMLTEKGLDRAMRLCKIPRERKDSLPTRSFEVQKIVNKLVGSPPDRNNYDPIDKGKRLVKVTRESIMRNRGFRQAVIEAYRCKCALCGQSLQSPDKLSWEVEAAHIVPNHSFGRDDICNGIALCHVHHWAFDVGWFTVLDNYRVKASPEVRGLPSGVLAAEVFRPLTAEGRCITLPKNGGIRPHPNALRWHREHVFYPSPITGGK